MEEFKLGVMPKISSEPIHRMASSYQLSQVLFTAVNYDIFTLLSGESKTAEQVASEIGTDFRITEKLLNALVALQLLTKANGKYSNTALAENFLVQEKPFYQGNVIKLGAKYDDWSKLGQVLKHGRMEREVDKWSEGEEIFDESFILAMKESAVCGELQRTVEVISKFIWFRKAKKLLDLGGGHGLYAIAFANENPKLEAIIFDFPYVVEISKKFINQYKMSDKIKVLAGDFTKNDIGNGYDIAFISNIYGQRIEEEVFGKIYGALNENGIFILKNWVIDKNRIGSPVSALNDLDMCFWENEDFHIYSIDEYVDLIEDYGFKIADVAKIGRSAILIFKKEVKNE